MKENLLTISELAYFSRVSRDTLLHYDKIGLISPMQRDVNNYRYYSTSQIGVVNLIRTMQSWGYTLENIKNVINVRSPQAFLDTYSSTIKRLDSEIDQLRRSKAVYKTLHSIVSQAVKVDEQSVSCEYQEASTILLGPVNDYKDGKSDYDALVLFYRYCRRLDPNINLNWCAWGMFNGQRIANGDWHYPDRFYFCRPNSPDVKPAGYYVVGYTRGNYGLTNDLYVRILEYIEKHKLRIIGDCYEDYILNEIVTVDPTQYLIRASIQVSEPETGGGE